MKKTVPEDMDAKLVDALKKQAKKDFRKILKDFIEKFKEIKPYLSPIYDSHSKWFKDECFDLSDLLNDLDFTREELSDTDFVPGTVKYKKKKKGDVDACNELNNEINE